MKNNEYNQYEKKIIDLLPELIVLVKPEGEILQINNKMTQSLTGKNINLIGKNILDYFSKEVIKKRTEMNHMAFKTKKPVSFIDKRGNQWFESKYTPIFDSNGKAIQILATVKNVTEKKLTENDLITLLDNMDEGVFTFDKNGRVTYVNNIIAERSGFTKKELYKLKFQDFVLPEYEEIMRENFKELLDGHEIEPFEIGYFNKKKEKIFVEIRGRAIYENGKIIGGQCLTFDLTNFEKTKEALHDSEKTCAMVVEQANDGLVVIQKGMYKFVNEAWIQTIGYSHDELMKMTILDVVVPEHKYIVMERHEARLRNEFPPPIYNVRVKCKNGAIKTIELSANVIDFEGQPANMAVIRDITKRKQLTEKLDETTKHLNNVISNVNEIIFTINKDRKISLWNYSAEKVSEIKFKVLKNKSFSDLDFIENHKEVSDFIEQVFSGKKRKLDTVIIRTRTGSTHILKPSVSIIKNNEDNISDIVFICKDITFELELHEKLSLGSSYYINEVDNLSLKNLLLGYINEGRHCLFISREPVEIEPYYSGSHYMNIQVFSSLKENVYPFIKNPDELKESILNFIKSKKKPVVFIDRIDYLFNIYGFQKMFPVLCEINDVIKKHQAILFLRINKNILSEKEFSITREEYALLPTKKLDEIFIDETLFEILEYIHNENKWNKIVNQNKIGKKFGISKLTTQKRVTELTDKGLLFTRSVGRAKQIYISIKGKEIIKKRTN